MQASVMAWGGVAKSPVVPRGVEVGPGPAGAHPWDCLREQLHYLGHTWREKSSEGSVVALPTTR